ncbi:MAG: hypothetical protein K9G39_09670 [Chlorobium sp.]|uniref:hypothetical protein n=1 Tax=Chlorobium sp. TaxID=1095 RepID=UPI0025BAE6F8|nr:hypothetical protein [Chlorobium sp.]MCF8383836.1 hypothetical protein [Chlorobium sp.]
MKIGILGATGLAGKSITRQVVAGKTGKAMLLGRNRARLELLREELLPEAASLPDIAVIDLKKQESLKRAFEKIDILVIAVSSAEHLPAVVRAALDTKTDCLDILLCSKAKRDFLASMRTMFEKLGLCYITDGGYHPGVPAAMARWAETLCPGLRSVDIFGSFGLKWQKNSVTHETLLDFMRELKAMDMSVLQDREWLSSWKHVKRFDFRDGRGKQDCAAMGMDEIQLLTGVIPTLKNAGFYIAGFGRPIDWAFMPLSLAALHLFPKTERHVARFFRWGLERFGPDTEWAILHCTAQGDTGSIEIAASYPDPYAFTALPVIACLKQYADTPRRPGLWHQALYVEPERFWLDLQVMGVKITCSTNPKA